MLLPLSSKVWGMDDETLHYNVHYKWGFIDADAGVATLTTEVDSAGGTFTSTLTGRSVNLLGHVYTAGDTISGQIMTDTFQPVYTQRISQEEGEFSIETITYDTSASSTAGEIVKRLPDGEVVRSRVSHYGGGLTLDLLAVFYYMRQLDYEKMNPGDKTTINVFAGTTPETLTAVYDGLRQWTIGDTTYPVYAVSLSFSLDHDGRQVTDTLDVLIDASDSRIPLYIDGQLKVGHMICRYIPDAEAVHGVVD